MPVSTDDLYQQALELSGNTNDTFLELAKVFRQLLDRDPDLFKKAAQKANMKPRKAYYLAEISRVFDSLPIAKSRLKKIGWTKLQTLAKHINKGNAQELLKLAEELTDKQLKARMKGEEHPDNAHCVLMYFTPEQYAILEEKLLQHGGSRSGRGILDKEKALIAALEKLQG